MVYIETLESDVNYHYAIPAGYSAKSPHQYRLRFYLAWELFGKSQEDLGEFRVDVSYIRVILFGNGPDNRELWRAGFEQ